LPITRGGKKENRCDGWGGGATHAQTVGLTRGGGLEKREEYQNDGAGDRRCWSIAKEDPAGDLRGDAGLDITIKSLDGKKGGVQKDSGDYYIQRYQKKGSFITFFRRDGRKGPRSASGGGKN